MEPHSAPGRDCGKADHPGPALTLPIAAEFLERASQLFRAIGDAPRLRLLALLSQRPACVSELARFENESVSTISQRLRVLRSERLVLRKRQGRHVNYSLADQHVADLVSSALAHSSEVPAQAVMPAGIQSGENSEQS